MNIFSVTFIDFKLDYLVIMFLTKKIGKMTYDK